jgi:hypothetical protein
MPNLLNDRQIASILENIGDFSQRKEVSDRQIVEFRAAVVASAQEISRYTDQTNGLLATFQAQQEKITHDIGGLVKAEKTIKEQVVEILALETALKLNYEIDAQGQFRVKGALAAAIDGAEKTKKAAAASLRDLSLVEADPGNEAAKLIAAADAVKLSLVNKQAEINVARAAVVAEKQSLQSLALLPAELPADQRVEAQEIQDVLTKAKTVSDGILSEQKKIADAKIAIEAAREALRPLAVLPAELPAEERVKAEEIAQLVEKADERVKTIKSKSEAVGNASARVATAEAELRDKIESAITGKIPARIEQLTEKADATIGKLNEKRAAIVQLKKDVDTTVTNLNAVVKSEEPQVGGVSLAQKTINEAERVKGLLLDKKNEIDKVVAEINNVEKTSLAEANRYRLKLAEEQQRERDAAELVALTHQAEFAVNESLTDKFGQYFELLKTATSANGALLFNQEFVSELLINWHNLTEIVRFMNSVRDSPLGIDPEFETGPGEENDTLRTTVVHPETLLDQSLADTPDEFMKRQKKTLSKANLEERLRYFVGQTLPGRLAYLTRLSVLFLDKYQKVKIADKFRNELYRYLVDQSKPLLGSWMIAHNNRNSIMKGESLGFLNTFYHLANNYLRDLKLAFSTTFGVYDPQVLQDFTKIDLDYITGIVMNRTTITNNIMAIEKTIKEARALRIDLTRKPEKRKAAEETQVVFGAGIYAAINQTHVWQSGEKIRESVNRDIATFFASSIVAYLHLRKLLENSADIFSQTLILFNVNEIQKGLEQIHIIQHFQQEERGTKTLSAILMEFFEITVNANNFTTTLLAQINDPNLRAPTTPEPLPRPKSPPGSPTKEPDPKKQKTPQSVDDDNPESNLSMMAQIGDEEIDEDELRVVFARAMKMYLAERRMKK